MLRFLIPVVLSLNVFAMPPRMKGEQMDEMHQKMKIATEQNFSEADTDKDGYLNPQEFTLFDKKMKDFMEKNKPSDKEIFDIIDKNQDGVISKDELRPRVHGGQGYVQGHHKTM